MLRVDLVTRKAPVTGTECAMDKVMRVKSNPVKRELRKTIHTAASNEYVLKRHEYEAVVLLWPMEE